MSTGSLEEFQHKLEAQQELSRLLAERERLQQHRDFLLQQHELASIQPSQAQHSALRLLLVVVSVCLRMC